MKKQFKNFLYMAIIAVTALMTGCSDDDDNNDNNNDNNTTVASATYKVTLSCGEEMLALFDITLEWTDPSGETESEKLTEQTITKEFQFNTFPATCSYNIKSTLKDGVELTQESYHLGFSYSEKTYVYSSDKTTISTAFYNNSGIISIGADNVEQYAKKYADISKTVTAELNENKTDVNWK